MALQAVTDASFDDDVLKSDMPVAVLFWAVSSGPSRLMIPVLEAIAAEYGDQITTVGLDIDQNPATTATYGIISIPTTNVYQGGEVVTTIVGAQPKAAVEQELAEFIRG